MSEREFTMNVSLNKQEGAADLWEARIAAKGVRIGRYGVDQRSVVGAALSDFFEKTLDRAPSNAEADRM